MAGKLYWRVKKNGKWTWIAATSENTLFCVTNPELCEYLEEEE